MQFRWSYPAHLQPCSATNSPEHIVRDLTPPLYVMSPRNSQWPASRPARLALPRYTRRTGQISTSERGDHTLHAARCTLHAARCTLHAARCTLALELTAWIRDDLTAIGKRHDTGVAEVTGVGGYACRTRNHQSDAPVSEHASGNAFDLQSIKFTDGKVIELTMFDAAVKEIRAEIQKSACARFLTVLGPWSRRLALQSCPSRHAQAARRLPHLPVEPGVTTGLAPRLCKLAARSELTQHGSREALLPRPAS